MLDLRRLRYFRAIAAHGSLSAAARALNVAQPALSHHIGEMERTLGVPLLERFSQGVRLTAVGRLLLERAHVILEYVELAEADIMEAAQPMTGVQSRVVSLAMIPTMAPLTSMLIEAIERTLPQISLHLIEARTNQSHEMIESGTVDFAVNLADSKPNAAEPLIWDPLYFVSAATPHDGDSQDPIRFCDLACERLITPGQENPIRILIERIAQKMGIHLNVILEIDGPDPRKQAVAAGLGSTLMSWLGVREEYTAGLLKIRSIIDPPVMRPVMLEYRQGLEAELVDTMRGILKRVAEAGVPDAELFRAH
ncbi:MAG: LysR family transcriptional regulator [Rhodospirillales bacterium]|jgi:LysR family nitrogen assimilation transcriptional regulator|nr:LysR family transcriptional regulator [Rhodospirillales bacterium]